MCLYKNVRCFGIFVDIDVLDDLVNLDILDDLDLERI